MHRRHGNADGALAVRDSAVAFQVLVYPVISFEAGITHWGSRTNLLGDSPTDEEVRAMSNELQVTETTPPALLIHSADDQTAPVDNSLRYFQACTAKGVPAELHVYPTGGHGYGMWADAGTLADWPPVLDRWLRSLDLVKVQPE